MASVIPGWQPNGLGMKVARNPCFSAIEVSQLAFVDPKGERLRAYAA
jgi:hypothetical protein